MKLQHHILKANHQLFFILIIIALFLTSQKSFAAANSGVTINLGFGGTALISKPKSHSNTDKTLNYQGSQSFVTLNALIGYQYKINNSFTVGLESGLSASSGIFEGTLSTIGIGVITLGTSINNISSSKIFNSTVA